MRARLLAGIAAGPLALVTLAAVPASAADRRQALRPARCARPHRRRLGQRRAHARRLHARRRSPARSTCPPAPTPSRSPPPTPPTPAPRPSARSTSPLEAGKNYTAVAHLDAAGAPDRDPVHQRHLRHRRRRGPAHGPARRRGPRRSTSSPAARAVITNLTNPNEQVLNLPAGTVSASVDRHRHHDARAARPGRRPRHRGHQHDRLRVGQRDRVARPPSRWPRRPSTGLHCNPSGVNAGQVGLVSDSGIVRRGPSRSPGWPSPASSALGLVAPPGARRRSGALTRTHGHHAAARARRAPSRRARAAARPRPGHACSRPSSHSARRSVR